MKRPDLWGHIYDQLETYFCSSDSIAGLQSNYQSLVNALNTGLNTNCEPDPLSEKVDQIWRIKRTHRLVQHLSTTSTEILRRHFEERAYRFGQEKLDFEKFNAEYDSEKRLISRRGVNVCNLLKLTKAGTKDQALALLEYALTEFADINAKLGKQIEQERAAYRKPKPKLKKQDNE